MRISEAIQLGRDDLDRDEGVLTVWHSKFGNYAEPAVMPSRAECAVEGLGRSGEASA
jgi:hypothetical protein